MTSPFDSRRAMCFVFLVACGCFAFGAAALGQNPRALTREEQQELRQGLAALKQSLRPLTERGIANAADAGVFHKGLAWALQYDTEFTPADLALLRKGVIRGQERVKSLAEGTDRSAIIA